MAMDYIVDITTLFGQNAAITGTGAAAELTYRPAETGSGSNFGNPETAAPEGLLLALLQKAFDEQLITLTRAMEITKSAIISTKDGVQVNGEQYTVRIFSGTALGALDPDGL